MISVGVRDLKNQLSRYLQYVKKGERVVITEHKRIIAELSPPREETSLVSVEEKLKHLSSEGKVVLADRNRSIAQIPETSPDLNWRDIYTAVREDSFE